MKLKGKMKLLRKKKRRGKALAQVMIISRRR
jgi:hypothetical protein